jgi:hypothetical protein
VDEIEPFFDFTTSNTIVSEPQNPRVYTELASHFCRFWQNFLDDQAIEFTSCRMGWIASGAMAPGSNG